MGRRAPRSPAPAAAAACAGVALSLLLAAGAPARASPVSYGSEVALGAGLGCCGEVCDLATGRCECLAAEVDAEASPDLACECCDHSKVAEAPEVRAAAAPDRRAAPPPPRL